MPPRKRTNQKGETIYFYREVVIAKDGSRHEITGTPKPNSYRSAVTMLNEHARQVYELCYDPRKAPERHIQNFSEWFNGRFWEICVEGKELKKGYAQEQRRLFDHRLKASFGSLPLDQIDASMIIRWRKGVRDEGVSAKTCNNYVGILTHALNYAFQSGVIKAAPRVDPLPTDSREIDPWTFNEYARIVDAARRDNEREWYCGVLLAGEGGLRIGEIRELKWSDIDLVGGSITVSRQIRHGFLGLPKGGRRRTIPMTKLLKDALAIAKDEAISEFVVCNRREFRTHKHGSQKTDGQCNKPVYRIYAAARVPEKDADGIYCDTPSRLTPRTSASTYGRSSLGWVTPIQTNPRRT